ncbi:hypothetical protein AAY473_031646 [Plecturocebus cupreus]
MECQPKGFGSTGDDKASRAPPASRDSPGAPHASRTLAPARFGASAGPGSQRGHLEAGPASPAPLR